MLTREQILGAADLRTENVSVPEWGGELTVRTMTGEQRDRYEQSLFANRTPDAAANLANVRARLVVYSVVDAAGAPLFTEADIEALGKKSAVALDRVVNASRKLSALSDEDVEELKKPSAPTDEGASISSLPAP